MILISFMSWLLWTGAGKPVAPIFVCRDVKTTIYSEAPLENIEAISQKGAAVIDLGSREVQFTVSIPSFQFRKSLMQEHFNENYMESDKFPNARFKGRINETISTAQSGEIPVTVTGELDIHGVKQVRTISGTLRIDQSSVGLKSSFTVACKDHQIKIPTLVFKNIAETIKVTVTATLTPYTK